MKLTKYSGLGILVVLVIVGSIASPMFDLGVEPEVFHKLIIGLVVIGGMVAVYDHSGLQNDAADVKEVCMRQRIGFNITCQHPLEEDTDDTIRRAQPTDFLGYAGKDGYFYRSIVPLIVDLFRNRLDPTSHLTVKKGKLAYSPQGRKRTTLRDKDVKRIKSLLSEPDVSRLGKQRKQERERWRLLIKAFKKNMQEYFSQHPDPRLTLVIGLNGWLEDEIVQMSGFWLWRGGKIWGVPVKGEPFTIRHPPRGGEPVFEHEVTPHVWFVTRSKGDVLRSIRSIVEPWGQRVRGLPPYLQKALDSVEESRILNLEPTRELLPTGQWWAMLPEFARNMVVQGYTQDAGGLGTISVVEAVKSGGVCIPSECDPLKESHRIIQRQSSEIDDLRRGIHSLTTERKPRWPTKKRPIPQQIQEQIGMKEVLGGLIIGGLFFAAGLIAAGNPEYVMHRDTIWAAGIILAVAYWIIKARLFGGGEEEEEAKEEST